MQINASPRLSQRGDVASFMKAAVGKGIRFRFLLRRLLAVLGTTTPGKAVVPTRSTLLSRGCFRNRLRLGFVVRLISYFAGCTADRWPF